jgi:hypothetical protein
MPHNAPSLFPCGIPIYCTHKQTAIIAQGNTRHSTYARYTELIHYCPIQCELRIGLSGLSIPAGAVL